MSETREAQPFKDYFGPELAEDLARRIAAVHPPFPAATFVAEVSGHILGGVDVELLP